MLAHVDRRRDEGMTDCDILRCLRSHVGNEAYSARSFPASNISVDPDVK